MNKKDEPGIGKSKIITKTAKKLKLRVVKLKVKILHDEDMLGFPVKH